MQRHHISHQMEREILYRMAEFEEPVTVGKVAGATGLSFGEAGAALNDMEMLRWVERAGTAWRLTERGDAEIHP